MRVNTAHIFQTIKGRVQRLKYWYKWHRLRGNSSNSVRRHIRKMTVRRGDALRRSWRAFERFWGRPRCEFTCRPEWRRLHTNSFGNRSWYTSVCSVVPPEIDEAFLTLILITELCHSTSSFRTKTRGQSTPIWIDRSVIRGEVQSPQRETNRGGALTFVID